MPASQPSEPVASFPPALATAVTDVLVQSGIPAWALPGEDDEQEVHVAAGMRDEALRVIAMQMEAVSQRAGGPPTLGAPHQPDDRPADDRTDAPPLMMEQIRRVGIVIAVVLAPLLAITLASPPLPRRWSLAVYAAGVWFLLWWRATRR
ncbi:MAG TPA: hypothetical protein VML96_06485 [Egibacteraceae bacterium]|nr:hypothetical protein [Egibacteraceae bacterium]